MNERGSGRTCRELALATVLSIGAGAVAGDVETWRGIRVVEEHRCSSYERSDYRYPASIESRIVASQTGRVYGPYTGRTFSGPGQTDIEHIVATSEAHDSGLCAASKAVRRQFATDLMNLTLAAPEVNRCSADAKCGKDAAEWLPDLNQCWFVARIIQVRRKYGLTIDAMEAMAIDSVITSCDSFDLIVLEGEAMPAATVGEARPSPAGGSGDALALWDDNRNGRITCREARRHGIAPVPRSHPAYRFMRDGDGDGVVCE